MTEVAFHFNAPDKLGYACRLLRKAVGTGARVMVTGDSSTLRELDVALWTFAPLEFLAHCALCVGLVGRGHQWPGQAPGGPGRIGFLCE